VKVRFWGVRGSLPVSSAACLRMGGNTSCTEVRAGNEIIILDAGSGIRPLGNKLMKEGKPVKAHLFFGHVHHDHIQGFPFFVPAFIPTTQLKIYSEKKEGMGPKDILNEVMKAPFFPAPLAAMRAQMEFIEIKENQTIEVGPNVVVKTYRLNHPNGCVGFRVESTEKGKKRVFAYVTDTEHYPEPDQNVIELSRNADAMLYDSAYTPEEYETKKSWGHSTYVEGIKLAKLAKAKRLLIYHHAPEHTDKDMTKILAEARKSLKSVHLAYEGLELSF